MNLENLIFYHRTNNSMNELFEILKKSAEYKDFDEVDLAFCIALIEKNGI